jgi:hypothetical protein
VIPLATGTKQQKLWVSTDAGEFLAELQLIPLSTGQQKLVATPLATYTKRNLWLARISEHLSLGCNSTYNCATKGQL